MDAVKQQKKVENLTTTTSMTPSLIPISGRAVLKVANTQAHRSKWSLLRHCRDLCNFGQIHLWVLEMTGATGGTKSSKKSPEDYVWYVHTNKAGNIYTTYTGHSSAVTLNLYMDNGISGYDCETIRVVEGYFSESAFLYKWYMMVHDDTFANSSAA